jgi:hypothetical protein
LLTIARWSGAAAAGKRASLEHSEKVDGQLLLDGI